MSTASISAAKSHARVWERLRAYWALIKDLQTGLLLTTALAGYASGCCTSFTSGSVLALFGSLFLAVGGTTVLNMAYDRDIDARMARTKHRPLPSGRIAPQEAWVLGGLMLAAGLAWSLVIDPLYAGVVAAGAFLDGVVYTVWLKRRTPFSILLGGLSGGMPALAGRTLAAGSLDGIGLLLALGVLLWIPTHIMTFTIKYQADYARAGVPTFPGWLGVRATRWIIALSTLLAVAVMAWTAALIGLSRGLQGLLAVCGAALVGLVLAGLLRPSRWLNFALYKGASIYMLLAMLFIIYGGL